MNKTPNIPIWFIFYVIGVMTGYVMTTSVKKETTIIKPDITLVEKLKAIENENKILNGKIQIYEKEIEILNDEIQFREGEISYWGRKYDEIKEKYNDK